MEYNTDPVLWEICLISHNYEGIAFTFEPFTSQRGAVQKPLGESDSDPVIFPMNRRITMLCLPKHFLLILNVNAGPYEVQEHRFRSAVLDEDGRISETASGPWIQAERIK